MKKAAITFLVTFGIVSALSYLNSLVLGARCDYKSDQALIYKVVSRF